MGKMYGTINVLSVHARGVKRCEQHNRRQFEPSKMPENVDPSRVHLNEEWIADGKSSFKEVIDERLKGLKVRKSSVVLLEYILGASPEFFKRIEDTPKDQPEDREKTYLKDCEEFVYKRHGKENVIAINKHFDEKTPHVHMLVVPIVEKDVRWKNRNGEGVKRERRLCARDFTGHPDMLRKLQQDFYEHVIGFAALYDLEFAKHVSAQEQSRAYNKEVDHRIAEIYDRGKQAKQELLGLQLLLEQLEYKLKYHEHDLKEKIKLEKQATEIVKGEMEIMRQAIDDMNDLDQRLKERREKEEQAQISRQMYKGMKNGQGKIRNNGQGFQTGM